MPSAARDHDLLYTPGSYLDAQHENTCAGYATHVSIPSVVLGAGERVTHLCAYPGILTTGDSAKVWSCC